MPSFKRPIGASGLLALALVAAACGSGGDDAQTTESGASTESSVAAETPSTDESDGAADAAEPSATEESDGAAAPSTDAEPEAEAEGPRLDDHVFPDLETVNIVDGTTVNLADQLAGGDTPILLWFFAPH
ncbi:MAG: hypothetical protein AAGA93_04600 [Actinomycetota bacterium]